MDAYRAEEYGEKIAGEYDEMYGTYDESCIGLLEELAHCGPVLELGIGTGRIAIPLKNRGIDIHGIDASQAMVDKLNAKPGGKDIPVTIADFVDLPTDREFELIFVVFNTIFGLTDQEAQLLCMKNVAGQLRRNGRFVVEAFVPDLGRFRNGQNVSVTDIGNNYMQMNAAKHDPVTQQITSQLMRMSESGIHMYPVTIRYMWPAEMDMMARAAGLKLVDRWGDWDRRPLTADSRKHVSVYKGE